MQCGSRKRGWKKAEKRATMKEARGQNGDAAFRLGSGGLVNGEKR